MPHAYSGDAANDFGAPSWYVVVDILAGAILVVTSIASSIACASVVPQLIDLIILRLSSAI
jgi:hypothetical protein